MALQGTLDTFELPDVLRLLSSTRKTGRLRLESDRGIGDVWLADGGVVGLATGGSPVDDVATGVFDLLRARDGSFAFEPGETPAHALAPSDVEALLGVAEERLQEWRSIEAVVPSLAAWVALAPELPTPDVTLDAGTWRLLATIAGGLTVGELGQVLGLGEVEVSRLVRDLVELGVGAVGPAPVATHASAAVAAAPVVEEPAAPLLEPAPVLAPTPVVEPADEAMPTYEAMPAYDETPAYEPAPVFEVTAVDRAPLFGLPEPAEEAPILSSLSPAEWDEPAAPAPAIDDDEVARQLAMLSPRAAEAVAAAAAGGSEEDRQAALAAVEAEAGAGDDDEPINRGLLLKFLSSVKG